MKGGFLVAFFVCVDCPLCAVNSRSTKINEGLFLLIFSLTENIAQCRFMIGSDCLADFLQMKRLIVADHHIGDIGEISLKTNMHHISDIGGIPLKACKMQENGHSKFR